MKRSEMIAILEDSLVDNHKYCSVLGSSFCYDSILKALEEAGMLPPERFNSPEGGFVNEWETE